MSEPIPEAESLESYRMRLAAAGTAAIGYHTREQHESIPDGLPWKECPTILSVIGLYEEKERLRAQKDGAYSERNQTLALLARMALALGWKAGVGQHPAEDTSWEGDWRTILFMELPTGQASWHFHDSERHLLEGLPVYEGAWDGHATPEKYERVAEALR